MDHTQITGIDLAVIGIYLIVMILIGVASSKKIKNSNRIKQAGT